MPKIISEKKVYDGGIKVMEAMVDFEKGRIHKEEYRILPNVVAMVAIDNYRDVYLSKEWRPAHESYILQIPAGKCKSSDEDALLKQAHNELREEVGMDARKMQKLYSCPMTSSIRSIVHIYLARDIFKSEKSPDPDEFIEVVKMPFDDALNLFETQKEKTISYSLLGMLLAKRELGL